MVLSDNNRGKVMARAKKLKDHSLILESENDKLKKIIKEKDKVIRQKDRTINQLKGEVKTAVDAFMSTKKHYDNVSEKKTLMESIKEANLGKYNNSTTICPKCAENLKRLVFTGFYIEVCNKCGYRSRING